MISSLFRGHPERNASGKVTVFGPSLCDADRMRAYAARRNPNAPDAANLYLEYGERYGIRGDMAFCQAMLDTKVWTSEPEGPPWKPFAYPIWGGLSASWAGSELEQRIDRHLRELYAIASEREEETFCWEDLGGIWALPGRQYGWDVVAIWRNMTDWRRQGEEDEAHWGGASELAGKGMKYTLAGREAAAADLAWLSERGSVPEPSPHPDRKVSWAELARVLRFWDSERKESS